MLPKINVSGIVLQHFETLKSHKTKKRTWNDRVTFFIIPSIVSVGFIYQNYKLDKDSLDVMIATLSILAGFSFNLQAIVFGYRDKIERSITNEDSIKNIYIKQIHSNISFSIINALASILLLFINRLTFSFAEITFQFLEIAYTINFIKVSVQFILYFSLIFYLLTLLMIVKRLNLLFNKEFDENL